MKVYDYLHALAMVELKNALFLDEQDDQSHTQTIRADKFKMLLHLLNAGIKELNTRFLLQEKNTRVIELPKGTHIINLKDSPAVDEWGKDIIRVSDVYLLGVEPSQMGMQYLPAPKLVLPDSRLQTLQYIDNNDIDGESPCYFMMDVHTMCVYSPYDFATYQVVCQVAQGADGWLELSDELPIPLSYHNALGLYIASRYFRSMDNQLDGDIHESTRYYQAYIQEVQLLENKGMALDRQPQQHLFHQKGFV